MRFGTSRNRALACAAPALLVPILAPQSPAPAPKAAPSSGALQPFVQTMPDSTVKFRLVPIPGGKIKIRDKEVEIKPFYFGATEVPWEVFDVFYTSGTNSPPYDQTEFTADAIALPSKSYILPDLGWGHNGWPAINVSYLSADMFCRWLSSKTGKKYRLPTEAEWEWACRAGAAGPVKLAPKDLDKIAWWAGNSMKMTHPVGKKQPSKWKLYDIYGNAGEWASDMDGQPVLCGGSFREGAAAQTPTNRKRKTPKWQETDPQLPKSRWWLADAPFAGFRVVCEAG